MTPGLAGGGGLVQQAEPEAGGVGGWSRRSLRAEPEHKGGGVGQWKVAWPVGKARSVGGWGLEG